MAEGTAYEGPAIVELMGHRRLVGHVAEAEMYGTRLLRVDVPQASGGTVTQLYGGGSIYCITPTTEEVVRRMSRANEVEPVRPWELPAADDPEDYQGSFDDEPFDREE